MGKNATWFPAMLSMLLTVYFSIATALLSQRAQSPADHAVANAVGVLSGGLGIAAFAS